MTSLADVERGFEQTKKEFSNCLNARKDTIEELRGEISSIDKEIKAKLNEHSDYILEMEVHHQKEVADKTQEMQEKLSACKQHMQRLQKDVDEIFEFEREKANYDAKLAKLSDDITIAQSEKKKREDSYEKVIVALK
jgi:chromosome segregation ATPase